MSALSSSIGGFMQPEDEQNTPSTSGDDMAIAELSDETLESVAGGRTIKKENVLTPNQEAEKKG